MSDNVHLSTFPDSPTTALTMLYMQNQDIAEKTPEELQTMYYETYYALRKDYNEKRSSGWLKSLSTEAR